ncbi:EamA family transporter [Pseudodesulfovibrio cashew]|uniref:EamA family transporter n=1 Tax=Pseudodesulfovibrio cashew TaxID=2678688 RepID=A0A6I6JHV1_9BACT|nr:DMT family transporter [Pseudodesulfovibrio cashew]QGY39687.1 EamA family transporter [Pseudodesulfovibrio cashew]
MILTRISALLPDDSRDKGRLAALGGGLLISFDPVFIRLSGTGGFDTAFLFGLFTAISMFLLIRMTDERGVLGVLRDGGWPLVVSGLLILGSASTFVLSVKHTAVANTMIILSGRPVLTALASWIFLRERTSKALWLAIVGVIAGIFIVVSGSLESGNVLGDGLALITVTCLGLNGTLWRRYKSISRLAVVGLGGLFIALVMFVPAAPSDFSPATWLVMAAMGLGSAPLGRVLNAVSSRYIPAAEMATIALSSAVLAPGWVFLIFAEQPSAATLLGGTVVLGSIFSYIVMTRQRA